MLEYIKNWVEKNGPVPDGKEIHHKIPKRLGGTDDVENLEAVTREEHAQRHLELYEKHNDIKDYTAYCMLSGKYDSEMRKVAASAGGKIGGRISYEKNLGIHTEDKEKKRKWASIGGKASVKAGNNKEWQYWASKEGRKKRASMGGKSSILSLQYWLNLGLTNEEAKKKMSEIGRKAGSIGGKKNKGQKWVTNGKKAIRVKEEELDVFLKTNTDYRKGRK